MSGSSELQLNEKRRLASINSFDWIVDSDELDGQNVGNRSLAGNRNSISNDLSSSINNKAFQQWFEPLGMTYGDDYSQSPQLSSIRKESVGIPFSPGIPGFNATYSGPENIAVDPVSSHQKHSNSIAEAIEQDKIDKRERIDIDDRISKLQEIIPWLASDQLMFEVDNQDDDAGSPSQDHTQRISHKMKKSMILEKTVEYILFLQNNERLFEMEVNTLKAEVESLKQGEAWKSSFL